MEALVLIFFTLIVIFFAVFFREAPEFLKIKPFYMVLF
jgi:hypothetical protein